MEALQTEANLTSVVYVSAAPKELTSEEIKDLLSEIRGNNKRRQITGMLLYRGGNFLQVIEGPEAEIDGLIKALNRDSRHTRMIVLSRKSIAERQFSEWQMAFTDITAANFKDMEGYSPFMELSFTDAEFLSKPHLCYKLLLQFKKQCR